MKLILSRLPAFFYYLLITLPVSTLAQTPDTVLLRNAVQGAEIAYTSKLGSQLHLYNGVRYKEHIAKNTDRGIPYFESGLWTSGTIQYDGETFYGVPLLYDVVHDKLIIQHGVGGLKVELINQKLTQFSIPGHSFVHLTSDSLKGTSLSPGYYELVTRGKVSFWVKWRKELLDFVEDREIKAVFIEKTAYYLYLNHQFTSIQSMAEVIKTLGDRKELKKFIRNNKIRYRRDKINAIAQVVQYHNQGKP